MTVTAKEGRTVLSKQTDKQTKQTDGQTDREDRKNIGGSQTTNLESVRFRCMIKVLLFFGNQTSIYLEQKYFGQKRKPELRNARNSSVKKDRITTKTKNYHYLNRNSSVTTKQESKNILPIVP